MHESHLGCLLKTHLLGSTPDLVNQILQDLHFNKVPGNLTHMNLRTTASHLFPRVTGNHAPPPDHEPGGIDEAQGQTAHS